MAKTKTNVSNQGASVLFVYILGEIIYAIRYQKVKLMIKKL